jgi:hypothetical protein
MPGYVASPMGLALSTLRIVTKEMKGRYDQGTRRDRSAILDRLIALTGWHRDHAQKALRTATPHGKERPPRKQRAPVVKYLAQVIEALQSCWATLEGPTGKRLATGSTECSAERAGQHLRRVKSNPYTPRDLAE